MKILLYIRLKLVTLQQMPTKEESDSGYGTGRDTQMQVINGANVSIYGPFHYIRIYYLSITYQTNEH